MTDRYSGIIECPECKELTDFLYADEWGEIQRCDKCEKQFKIEMNFKTSKIKKEKK